MAKRVEIKIFHPVKSGQVVARTDNLKVELRHPPREHHKRPHVHIVRPDWGEEGISIAIDQFEILAGEGFLQQINENEYEALIEMISMYREKLLEAWEEARE